MKARAASSATCRRLHPVSLVIRSAACAAVAATLLASGPASAQLLVDGTNSAIGASASLPDAAHFQNSVPNSYAAAYIGYGVNGAGYMDNTSSLSAVGAEGGAYDTTGTWGVSVGIFDGAQGSFVNTGTGDVTSYSVRIGDAFGGATANGEFYQQSSGSVNTSVYLTVGNAGGTGKFVHSGSGPVNVNYQMFVGTYENTGTNVSNGTYSITNAAASLFVRTNMFLGTFGGTGTFTQQTGAVTVGNVGDDYTDLYGYQELYVGSEGTNSTAHYDLQGGTLTVNGWVNLGRDGGAAVFDNKGTVNVTQELRIAADYDGSGGTATLTNLPGGVIVAGQVYVGEGANGNGTLNMEGGKISTSGWVSVGRGGTGAMVQNGGEIFTNTNNVGYAAFGTGQNAGSHGTFTQNHGSITIINDWFVAGVDGTGTSTVLNDSTITAQVLAAGQNGGSNGTININNPGGSVTLTSIDFASLPAIVPIDKTGWVYIGLGAGSIGKLNLIAGTITNGDWTEIGYAGNGEVNVTGGSLTTGDNFRLGGLAGDVDNPPGGVGVVNQSAGTVTVLGNDPAYTGNLVVATDGTGTYNISGTGLLNLTAPDTGTNNAASFSITNNTMGAGHEFDLALDGNLVIAEGVGTGLVKQTGGTINVAANIFVGGEFGTGTGTLTIMSGTTNVGTTSPTGGDVIIAFVAGSTGTVNLSGGTLNVTHGSGIIGAGLGTAAFNFTGGTLKVNEFNNTVAGGNLGGLTQNGASSLLDVTGNDTTIHGFYTLTAGTATVGAGRILSTTGALTVGSGGTVAGSGTVVAPTVVVNPGGVFSPGSSPGTLTVQSSITFNGTLLTEISGTNIDKLAVTGNLTLGAGSVLDIQGNLATALTHVIATVTGSLTGTFSDATDATTNGYNVVYEANQIILDELDGDANHDGIVDIFDINLVSSNWNPSGPVAAFAPGNINHDTVVDIFDINQISSNWAHVATNGGPAHIQPVPEPSALVLLCLGGLALIGWRRNRGRRA